MSEEYVIDNAASHKSFSAASPRDGHAEDHTVAGPIAPRTRTAPATAEKRSRATRSGARPPIAAEAPMTRDQGRCDHCGKVFRWERTGSPGRTENECYDYCFGLCTACLNTLSPEQQGIRRDAYVAGYKGDAAGMTAAAMAFRERERCNAEREAKLRAERIWQSGYDAEKRRTERLATIKKAGAAARQAGEAITKNPFELRPKSKSQTIQNHNAWIEGYESAEIEAEGAARLRSLIDLSAETGTEAFAAAWTFKANWSASIPYPKGSQERTRWVAGFNAEGHRYAKLWNEWVDEGKARAREGLSKHLGLVVFRDDAPETAAWKQKARKFGYRRQLEDQRQRAASEKVE